jgi:hypothetical protein
MFCRKIDGGRKNFFEKIFQSGSFRDARRFILLAFRPFGAYEARMTRNERKDAINANFATISAVYTDGCPVVPPATESFEDSANDRLENSLRRVSIGRTGKFDAKNFGRDLRRNRSSANRVMNAECPSAVDGPANIFQEVILFHDSLSAQATITRT